MALQSLAAGAVGGIVSTQLISYYSKPSIFDTWADTISGKEFNVKYRQNVYVYNSKYKSGTHKNCRLRSFTVFDFANLYKATIPDNATITITYDDFPGIGMVRNITVTEATI